MPHIQRIPQVTPDDVERVVHRDFSADHYAIAMAILSGYRSTRVQLAALKLAHGNVQRLRACIEGAKADFRDILLTAEYPAYAKEWGRKLSAEEERRIIDSDWRQYEEWLKRPV